MKFVKLLFIYTLVVPCLLRAVPIMNWQFGDKYMTTIEINLDSPNPCYIGNYKSKTGFEWGFKFSSTMERLRKNEALLSLNKDIEITETPSPIIIPQSFTKITYKKHFFSEDEKIETTHDFPIDVSDFLKSHLCGDIENNNKNFLTSEYRYLLENHADQIIVKDFNTSKTPPHLVSEILIAGTTLYDFLCANSTHNQQYWTVDAEKFYNIIIPKSLLKHNVDRRGKVVFSREPITDEILRHDRNATSSDEIFKICIKNSSGEKTDFPPISFISSFGFPNKFKKKLKINGSVEGVFYVNHILKTVRFAQIKISGISLKGETWYIKSYNTKTESFDWDTDCNISISPINLTITYQCEKQ